VLRAGRRGWRAGRAGVAGAAGRAAARVRSQRPRPRRRHGRAEVGAGRARAGRHAPPAQLLWAALLAGAARGRAGLQAFHDAGAGHLGRQRVPARDGRAHRRGRDAALRQPHPRAGHAGPGPRVRPRVVLPWLLWFTLVFTLGRRHPLHAFWCRGLHSHRRAPGLAPAGPAWPRAAPDAHAPRRQGARGRHGQCGHRGAGGREPAAGRARGGGAAGAAGRVRGRAARRARGRGRHPGRARAGGRGRRPAAHDAVHGRAGQGARAVAGAAGGARLPPPWATLHEADGPVGHHSN